MVTGYLCVYVCIRMCLGFGHRTKGYQLGLRNQFESVYACQWRSDEKKIPSAQ